MLVFSDEARKILGCKTFRTLKKWCQANGVAILSDSGRNKRYVLKKEFEEARYKESLKHLAHKHGRENLSEVFKAYMNFNSEYASTKSEKQRTKQSPYNPADKNELKALSIFTRIINEL